MEPETEYRWAVRAENRDGSSSWVFGPRFTTPEEDPEEDIFVEDDGAATLSFSDSTSSQSSNTEIQNPFNIEIEFLSNFNEEDKEAIRYAAARWESLLVDVPDWQLPRGWGQSSHYCGSEPFTGPKKVDDLKIYVSELSGWGSTLGAAYPSLMRGNLTRIGTENGPGPTAYGCVMLKAGMDKEEPNGNSAQPFRISTLDLAAVEDMGYPVRMENASPFELNWQRGKVVAEKSDWCAIHPH